MKNLIIIGAGGFGREFFWHARESIGYGTEFKIGGYIEDFRPETEEKSVLQVPIISSIDDYQVSINDVFVCAISDVNVKEACIEKIKKKNGEFISVIHRSAIVYPSSRIGEGVIIAPNCVVTDNVSVGNHVMINIHSMVGHDAMIGDYSSIMSYVNITGRCKIGRKVFLASGVQMSPLTTIGDQGYAGIGSVVLKNVNPGVKVFGNPARIIEMNDRI